MAYQCNNARRTKRQAIDGRRLRRKPQFDPRRPFGSRRQYLEAVATHSIGLRLSASCAILPIGGLAGANKSRRGERDRAHGGWEWPKRGEVVATPPRRGFPLPSFTALRCFLLCPWISSDYLPPRSALAGRTGGGSIAVLADPARRDQALSRSGLAAVDRLQGAALPICRGGLGAGASDAEG